MNSNIEHKLSQTQLYQFSKFDRLWSLWHPNVELSCLILTTEVQSYTSLTHAAKINEVIQLQKKNKKLY